MGRNCILFPCPQDGTHLSMLHHPPLDFNIHLQRRQNSDSFLSRMEERKKARLSKPAAAGEEIPPISKQPRLSTPADGEKSIVAIYIDQVHVSHDF